MSDSDQPSHFLHDKPSIGLAAILRRSTAEVHEAVERLPIMLRLTSEEVTQNDYRHYIHVLAGIYVIVETAFYNNLDDALRERLGIRPKLPMLLRDLEEQGIKVPAMGLERDPGTPNRLDTHSMSAIVGGVYVLEGATLGGRTIARHLRRMLGAELGAASFLDFHGEQISAAWRHFSGALDDLCSVGMLLPDEVIAGALVTFDEIYRRLEQAGSTQ